MWGSYFLDKDGVKDEKLWFGCSLKNPAFMWWVQKKPIQYRGGFPKTGGAWTVCRFKGRGAAGEKEVGVFEWEVTQLFQLEMTHCGSKISHKTENYS